MLATRLAVLAAAPLGYLAVIASLAATLAYAASLGPFEGVNFSMLVTRGAQVILLLSLVPLARVLQLGVREIGLPASAGRLLYQLGAGCALGVLIMSLHVAMLLGLGAIRPNPEVVFSVSEAAATFVRVLWVGFLVATVEELIFRGMLLTWLRRSGGIWAAALVASTYYALLHFVKSDLRPAAAEVHWNSGFLIFGDAVRHLLTETPFDCLLALFCAGLFLAAVRLVYPRALGLCIGIHAGWVVIIKVARRLTDPDPHAPLAYLVGPYDQIIGYWAAGWITALLVIFLATTCRAAHDASATDREPRPSRSPASKTRGS